MSLWINLLDDFSSAGNSDKLLQKLSQHLVEHGVTSYFYGIGPSYSVVSERGIIGSMWYRTTHPEEYRDYFDNKFYIDDDLSAIHCMSRTSPFVWHDKRHWGEVATKRQLQFMEDSFAWDMGIGVSLPVRFGERGLGGLGLCCGQTDEKEFGKLWKAKRSEIMTISYLFDAFMHKEHLTEFCGLDKIKLKILHLLASGLARKEVAYKLNLHYSDISYHLTGARKALKARNNMQAVVNAMSSGLVTP